MINPFPGDLPSSHPVHLLNPISGVETVGRSSGTELGINAAALLHAPGLQTGADYSGINKSPKPCSITTSPIEEVM